MKLFWKQYLIAGLLVTIGAIFIHQKFNIPSDWSAFMMWLPAVWFLILGFALIFSFILNLGVKD